MACGYQADCGGGFPGSFFVFAPGYGIVKNPVRFFRNRDRIRFRWGFCWFSRSVAGGKDTRRNKKGIEKRGGIRFSVIYTVEKACDTLATPTLSQRGNTPTFSVCV